jgi:hypothetical protein
MTSASKIQLDMRGTAFMARALKITTYPDAQLATVKPPPGLHWMLVLAGA